MTKKMQAAAALAAAIVSSTMHAQTTGVSRPEQVPVTTSAEGIAQPVVYEGGVPQDATPTRQESAVPGLKVRTGPPPTAQEPGAVITTGSSAYVPYQPVQAQVASNTTIADKDEAGAIRWDIRSSAPRNLEADPDANIVARVAGPANQLPVGTRLMVRMKTALSTKLSKDGQEFHAELLAPVLRDGHVLLPAGSEVTGKLTDVHGGRRISGSATLRLEPSSVTLPDGTRYELRAQVIDTDLYKSTKIDEEGTIVKSDHVKRTAAVFALAAGSGAAAGAVFGGVPGALIGAGVGAGISTAIWLKGDRQTELPVGTKVVFALSKPMVFGAE